MSFQRLDALIRRPRRLRPRLVVAIVTLALAPGLAAAAPQQETELQLSLADALRLALEQNLDIQVIDYDRRIADENIVAARGFFDPVIDVGIPGATAVVGSAGGGFGQAAPGVGGIGYTNSQSPTTTQLSGADVNESASFGTQARISQRLEFGASYEVGYDVGRSTTNSIFTSLNPAWNNSMGFAVNMPLLRGRGREAASAQVLLARRNQTVSQEVFRTQVNTILFSVVQAYWELVFADRNLDVAERSLRLAEEQLGRTQAQVEVGMLAPVEETQAEVAVAQRRNDLIRARNSLDNSRDALRSLLRAEMLDAGWETELVVTEIPEVVPQPVDIEQELERARANRPEIASARAQVAARTVEVNAARNELLPALDLVGSLTYTGIGGDEIIRAGFPSPEVLEIIDGGYGDAVSQLFGFDFATWRVGFNFSIPIGNRTAKGNFARTTLAEDKARTELERADQQAVLEVRQAVRAVADAGELVVSTRATRELAQVQELRAMIDYRNAEAALARVTGTLAATYGVEIR